MRERDQTHSYWYIPSSPRENYSLLVMESTGMMKMATGEGLPPPAGCPNGSRLVFGGYGGFWQRNSRSIVLPKVFRVYGYIWEEEVGRWSCEGPTRVGARPGAGTPPCLVATLFLSWRLLQVPWITFVPKITLPKVSFRLDSVWYSFPAKHWNRQKTAICTGPWVSGLVPKII